MKVLKFGGTSVASADQIEQVKQIIADEKSNRVFVVVSALGGDYRSIAKNFSNGCRSG